MGMNPDPAFTPEARVPALDGLRGIAILTVLFGHFTWQEPRFDGGIGDIVFGLADTSWCGVDLFFVLSGFLITGILFDAKGSRTYFSSFYMRRVLRIFPLYYAVLIAAVFLVPALVPSDPKVQDLVARQGWLWGFSANLLIGWKQFWFFDTPYVSLGHFWSLAVEEHFYFLWPLAVFFLDRRRLMWLCVVLIGGALAIRLALHAQGATATPLYVLTWCRMDSLAAGAFLALAARGPGGIAVMVRPALAMFFTAGLILAWIVYRQGGSLNSEDMLAVTWGFSLFAALFSALLILAVTAPPASLSGRFFSCGFLRFFGKYSYALYVLQAVPRKLYHMLFPLDKLTALVGSYRVALGLFSLLLLGTMVLMALLSWHLYEKHFLKLKRFFPSAGGGAPASQLLAVGTA